jgi:two-component system nitrate/nitrite response regulator NarL
MDHSVVTYVFLSAPASLEFQPRKLIMKAQPSCPSSKSSIPIRVFVADRNHMGSQLLAESLGRDPRFEIAGIAAMAELPSLAGSCKADVALISVDSDSATRKGLQVARTVHSHRPDIQLVVLLEQGTRESVIASFRCGATGVFCRTEPLSELPVCIECVSQGKVRASPNHSQFLLEALRSVPSCEGIDTGKMSLLSHRELQVAECAAQGQSNKQIAERLNLSEHTIKNYLFRIFEKLGVSNRFELLFLLFKECNAQTPGEMKLPFGTDISYPLEAYIKAAEAGSVAAQFVVGMAHLEGLCAEQNSLSAYYWFRVAEANALEFGQRSREWIERLHSTFETHEIEALEQSITNAVQSNPVLKKPRPADLIKRSTNSLLLRVAI